MFVKQFIVCRFSKSITAVFLALMITNVHAALVFNTFTSLADFQAAAGDTVLEDFSGEADGAFASRDFTDFQIDIVNQVAFFPDDFALPQILNEELRIQQAVSDSESQLTFDTGISAFGFDFRNTDSEDSLELLVEDSSFVFGPAGNSGFFGIVAIDGLFNTISFSDTEGGGGILASGFIDNIQYTSNNVQYTPTVSASVAEPSAVVLLGFGLAGLGFIRKRRFVF